MHVRSLLATVTGDIHSSQSLLEEPAEEAAGVDDEEPDEEPLEEAPDDVPEVEVGCGLVSEAHSYGFATEALRVLLGEADTLGVRVRASVAPTNRAVIRVLAKCGFTELRGSTEDGELVMVRPLTGPVDQ